MNSIKDKSATQLNCGHFLHFNCAIDWFNKSPCVDIICPTCKQPANKIKIGYKAAIIEKREGEFDFPENFLKPAQIKYLESSNKLLIYKNNMLIEEIEGMDDEDITIIEDSDDSDLQIEIPRMITFRVPTGFRGPQLRQEVNPGFPYTRPLSCAICSQYAQILLTYTCRSCKAKYHLKCLREASKNHNWERRACRICLSEVLIFSYLLRSPFQEMVQSYSSDIPRRVKMTLLGQLQHFLLDAYRKYSTQTLPNIIFHGNDIIDKEFNSTREIRSNGTTHRERFQNRMPQSTTIEIQEIC